MTRRISLPDDTSAAAAARRAVVDALRERSDGLSDQADFVDDAILVASELASNGISHGRPPIELELESLVGGIRITVSNEGAGGEPRIGEPNPESGRGRGLGIVEALAERWGWQREGERVAVWAEVFGTLPPVR